MAQYMNHVMMDLAHGAHKKNLIVHQNIHHHHVKKEPLKKRKQIKQEMRRYVVTKMILRKIKVQKIQR